MAMRLNLVPDLGVRGNKRLAALLLPYLRDYGHLSCRDIARRWLNDQEFWAPRPWLRDLLTRVDRLDRVTHALAVLICAEERHKAMRGRARQGAERSRLGHTGRLRVAVPIAAGRAFR
ncbi:MAG: hypothetical protein FJZ01_04120 [Candidatus Sericytochromatia bacterium]|nr:hypothetical protein [Candidatus Tanganyikabacteria bacterium]